MNSVGKRSGCSFCFFFLDMDFSGRILVCFLMNVFFVVEVLYVLVCGGWC